MAVPTDKLADSDGPLLEVVQLGPLAVDTKLFAAIALFSLANTILINLITASRLLYGMGEEGVVPAIFRARAPGRRTPIVAIVFTTGVAMILILTGDLEALADTTVTLLLIAFIGVNAAVLASRRDHVEHDHFHVPSCDPGDRRDRLHRAAHPARGARSGCARAILLLLGLRCGA